MLVCRRFQKAAVQVKLASARKDAKQYRFQKLPRSSEAVFMCIYIY